MVDCNELELELSAQGSFLVRDTTTLDRLRHILDAAIEEIGAMRKQ